jgi:catechol 2,3-dioxygenase-like lactoylglutathione lyase family enzyme
VTLDSNGPVAPPILGQINLIVADLAKSVAFYRLLGLTIEARHAASAHHVPIRMANGFLLELDSQEFVGKWDPGWRGTGAGQNVIGFSVATRAEVDAIYARLTAAGHPGQLTPQDAFWGARYAIVEDPDGNPVGLMSPIEPERRSATPGF